MKKKKTSRSTSAKKTIRENLALQLVKELKDITEKLGHESKGLKKVIEKGAKKLAKKISKQVKPVKEKPSKSQNAVETNVTKPSPVIEVKNNTTTATPAKPVTKKAPAVKATVNNTKPKI